jgi:hypothetical protein
MCYFIGAYTGKPIDDPVLFEVCRKFKFMVGRCEGYEGFPTIKGMYGYHLVGGTCNCDTSLGIGEKANIRNRDKKLSELDTFIRFFNSLKDTRKLMHISLIKHWANDPICDEIENIHVEDLDVKFLLNIRNDVFYRIQLNLDEDFFARKFIQSFPEYEQVYKDDIEEFGEILGHAFFGAVINSELSQLLLLNEDKQRIRKFIDFIDGMYANGNNAVRNIVEVTILAYLGDDDKVLRNAFTHFSEDIMKASKCDEAMYGRRDIHIHYRKGNVLFDW